MPPALSWLLSSRPWEITLSSAWCAQNAVSMQTAPTPALPLQPFLATQWKVISYIPYFIVREGSVGIDKAHIVTFEDLGKHQGFSRDLLKATWQACASTEDLFLTVLCVAWDHQASRLFATILRTGCRSLPVVTSNAGKKHMA